MSVSTTTRKQSFAGGQAALTFTFKTLPDHPEYIKVTATSGGTDTILTYSSAYTVALTSDGVGGVVTLSPTYSTAYTHTVYRETTDKQESDYDDYNQFPADTLEDDLDRRTMVTQELAEENDRTLKAPISSTGLTLVLPTPVDANLLAWSGTGGTITNLSSANFTGSTGATGPQGPQGNVKGDGTENPTNLLANGDFESWSAGNTVAPDGWIMSGAGAAIQKAAVPKIGTFSAGMARGGTDCFLYQNFSNVKGIAYMKGRTFTFGCWVYATVASRARITLYDGYTTPASSYHSGVAGWEWLTCSIVINASSTGVRANCNIDTGNTDAYFDGAMCVEGASAFAFSPKPAEEGVWADYSATSTIVGWASFTNKKIYTKKIGKTVFVWFYISGTSNSADTSFSLPYTSATGNTRQDIVVRGTDSGSIQNGTWVYLPENSTSVTVFKQYDSTTGVWTASGAKSMNGQFFYEAA